MKFNQIESLNSMYKSDLELTSQSLKVSRSVQVPSVDTIAGFCFGGANVGLRLQEWSGHEVTFVANGPIGSPKVHKSPSHRMCTSTRLCGLLCQLTFWKKPPSQKTRPRQDSMARF